MKDNEIVELYWNRDETAITATVDTYGNYCHSIAYNILYNNEDAEECVNDTWMNAWNSIPPQRPNRLATYLGKLTRNIALNRYTLKNAQKRGGDEVALALEELDECIHGSYDVELQIQRQELISVIHLFVSTLPQTERRIFLLRYWYLESIQSIAERYGFTQSKVVSMLYRIRGKLRKRLEKEGYI